MPSLPLRVLLPLAAASAISSVAASVAVPAPASTAVTGSTTTSEVVLYDHCQQHPISYDLDVSALTPQWRLELQVADPDGHLSEGTVLNSAAGAATSGTVLYTFCGSEKQGTYTVRATGYTGPLLQVPFQLADTAFEVRPAATRTTVRRTALGHGRYRVAAKVLEQDEHGYTRADGVRVRIERRVHGGWRVLSGRTLTTVRGKAVTTVAAPRGARLRAVVPARHNYGGSMSAPVRL